MPRLSHKDFDALQLAILELYEYRDLESFRQMLPGFLLKLVPADHGNLCAYSVGPVPKMVRCVESHQALGKEVAWGESLVALHPFTQYFMQGGEVTAIKLSDFYTQNELKSSLFWDYLHRFELEYNLSLPVESQEGVAAVSVANHCKDFTERDRLIFNLIRPHFNQAQRNAEMAAARLTARTKPLAAYNLTPRETEVARWLGQGKSNPEIAMILQTSPRTVEKHMEKILEKLGVENRTAAATMITGSNDSSNHAPLPQRF
jgi:DNA-binding CsgD family transcriptional regulator